MAKKKGGKKKGGAQRTKAERKADVREKLLTSREGEEPAPHDASSTPIVAPAILASPRRELGDHRRSGHPWPPLLPEGASPP
ncbi:MAG: hypothetical protein HY720_01410, partial [Planctomycetes bacterium]|nr:hypothetical protein [Planctomycetota bacterium]